MSILDTTLLNFYSKLSKPEVYDTITLRQWVKVLKKSKKSSLILEAREGFTEIKDVKRILPAVTYNFLFKDYKKDSNIIHSTGLMYFDIDDHEFDISDVNLTKVLLLNKSVSGRNYSIVVKVDGVTLTNFKQVYEGIAKELGILGVVDTMAIKAAQPTLLSYDPDLYINEGSEVFYASKFLSHIPATKEKEEARYISEVGQSIPYTSLRYNNLTDYQFDCDYIVNWSGFTFIQCFIPFNNNNRNKYKTLLSYCTNLVWLNSYATYERVWKVLHKINNKWYNPPTSNQNIKRIVDTVFKQKEEKTLRPIKSKSKKIIFDTSNKSKLSREDKNEIVIDLLAQRKRDVSCKKIGMAIDLWRVQTDGKITIHKLAASIPMNVKTVKKYYPIFKDVVKLKNSPDA